MSICTLNFVAAYLDVSFIYVFIVNLSFFMKIKSTGKISDFVYKVYNHDSTFLIISNKKFSVYLKIFKQYTCSIVSPSINELGISLKRNTQNIMKRLIFLILNL